MNDVKEKGEVSETRRAGYLKSAAIILLVLAALTGGFYGIKQVNAVENQVTALSVNPNPIKLGSPAYVQYTLGQNAAVYLNVYNESGELVRELLKGATKSAGTYVQAWDGKDQNGVPAPDGSYRFTAEARDTTDAVIGFMELTALAARQPVISAVSDTPDPFDPTAGQQANITYTISADAKVTVTVLNGYVPVKTLTAGETQTAGTYTISWDGKNDAGLTGGDAVYTYQIDAVNPLVAAFKSTFKGNTTLEAAVPRISDFSAYPDPLKIASTSMTIRYSLSEKAKVTLKIVNSTGTAVRTLLNNAAKNAGYNSVIWDGKTDTGSYVPEGNYSVVISAVDNYNKPSDMQSIPFKAGYQPAISSVEITPDPYNPGDAGNPNATISYNISHESLVTVKILSGYTVVRTVYGSELQAAGTNTVLWNGMDDAGNTVGDGSYSCQITAVSPTVSTFSTTFKENFTVEKGAPEVTDLILTPNPFKLGSGSLYIRYNLSEPAAVTIDVKQGDTLVRNLASGIDKNAGYNTAVWDGKDGDGNLVGEGIYSIMVTAADSAGRSGEDTANVTAGYQAAISNISNTPDPFVPAADGTASATIGFDLSAGASVKVIIARGSLPVKTISKGVVTAGSQSVTWDGTDDSGKVVSDGSYTYTIEASSPTVPTFISRSQGTVTVESGPPAITDLSVNPYVVKIGSPAYLRYTLSEPADVTAQVLDKNGAAVRDFATESKSAGGYYSISWDTKNNSGNPVPSGDYIFKVSAVDKSDLGGSAQLAFQAGAVPVFTTVYAEPQVFNAADGEQTNLYYTLSEASYVTAKVANSTGTVIRTLSTYQEVGSGLNSITWDGASNTGQVTDGNYTYTIDASSVIGNFKAVQASGTVQVSTGSGTLPPPASCTDCHTGYPTSHPVNNCAGCHGNNEPIQDCASCHTNWGAHSNGSFLSTYKCEYCHNDTYSYKIPSHPADIDGIHDTDLAADCQKCHQTSLSVEHPLHTDETGNEYDCRTCHASTVSEVVYAIDNRLKNCDACHVQNDHEAVHTPTGIEQGCTGCHIDSLTREHLDNPTTQTDSATGQINPWTCGTCHASTVTEVVYAINNSLRNCDACHTQAGHQAQHTTTALDSNCTTCHINSLTDEHLNNPRTQTDSATGQIKPWDCNTCHASTRNTVVGAVYTANRQCAACHQAGHNMNFAEPVPENIPRYAGYTWTAPQNAFLWNGESWMPDEFLVGGRVIISSRRADVTGDQVWAFYRDEMAALGWTLESDAPSVGTNFYNVTFTGANNHKAVIWFYGGLTHNASDEILPAGYRIEIIYK